MIIINNILEILDLDEKNYKVVSIIGAGGKTSILSSLSKALNKKQEKVLVTTSTCLGVPKFKHNLYIGNIGKIEKEKISVYGEIKREDNILKSKNISVIDDIILSNKFDKILIEADGARRYPIKAPNNNEPVISKYTDITIAIIGMDSLGKEIKSTVHRKEIYCNLLKVNEYDKVTENQIYRLVLNNEGTFKNAVGEKKLVLNKIKTKEQYISALNLKKKIEKNTNIKVYLIPYIK